MRIEAGQVAAALRVGFLAVLAVCAMPAANAEDEVRTSHGLTLYGKLKYGPDFEHFEYVNPEAPKGGIYTYGWGNTFDTLHPFAVAGTPPAFRTVEAVLYDHLMVRSGDEATTLYGLIAESVSYPADLAWIEFRLREDARWHDGEPLTVEDVIFSLNILRNEGTPEYRTDYAPVTAIEQSGPHSVRIAFDGSGDRGSAYTIAQMPVLPKHHWEGKDFSKSSLEPPLTSGPYRITKVDPGRAYTMERVKDYWAKDLPVNRGRFNFDVIQHDYYRDININFEAFMAGKSDLRWETLPQQWATGYDVPAVKDGRLIKEMLPFSGSTFYAGFYFNLRRGKFSDPRVREAIGYAFDFEWLNKTVFYGEFVRLRSHFQNTELANTGVPKGRELELLAPYRDQLDARVFNEEWAPPETDATQESLRANLRQAAMLLREAGYTQRDGKLVGDDGRPLEFELLLWDPFWERVAGPFVANLKRLGITARMRLIDTSEWFRRMETFDYDMTQGFTLPQSLSPGAEQRDYWGSAAADQNGSRNWMGISDPVVDALIDKVVNAPDRESLVAATRALDRVLCWKFASVPYAYARGIPVAYWNRFGKPEIEPTWVRFIWILSNWWIDPEKDAALKEAGGKRAR